MIFTRFKSVSKKLDKSFQNLYNKHQFTVYFDRFPAMGG